MTKREQIKALEARIASLEARVIALEARPSITWVPWATQPTVQPYEITLGGGTAAQPGAVVGWTETVTRT